MYIFSNSLHRKFSVIIWEGLCVILEKKKKIFKRRIMDLILYQLAWLGYLLIFLDLF